LALIRVPVHWELAYNTLLNRVYYRQYHPSANARTWATSAEAAKGVKPQSVIKNQATQDELIANQQKQLQEAIERGGAKEKGRVLDAQGTQIENITRDTLEQVKGAKVTPDVRIGTGEGSVIDNVVERGGKSAYVESKPTIAEPNTRMINQLTNATKAAQPWRLRHSSGRPRTYAQ
jgi:hypothetical protein